MACHAGGFPGTGIIPGEKRKCLWVRYGKAMHRAIAQLTYLLAICLLSAINSLASLTLPPLPNLDHLADQCVPEYEPFEEKSAGRASRLI